MIIRNAIVLKSLLFVVLIVSAPAMAESSWFWQHPYPTGSMVNGIQFIDNDNGWIVTSMGEVFGTDNGGVTWQKLYKGVEILERVCFIDDTEGWACGEDGIVLHTTDGGQNWSSSYPTSIDLLSKIQSMQSGSLPGGEHSILVDGADLAPGLYFVRLNAGGLSETRTIVRIP